MEPVAVIGVVPAGFYLVLVEAQRYQIVGTRKQASRLQRRRKGKIK
jgi:hypothetical protein